MKIMIITNLYWLIIKGTHQNPKSRVELTQLKFLTTVTQVTFITTELTELHNATWTGQKLG